MIYLNKLRLKSISASIILILVTFAASSLSAYAAPGKETFDADKGYEDKYDIELFVFAPCESCHEEEKIEKEVRSKLNEAMITGLELKVYNAYKESGASRFEEITGEYGLDITVTDLPAGVVNGTVFTGTYEEIGKELSDHIKNNEINGATDKKTGTKNADGKDAADKKLKDSDFYKKISDIGKDDAVMVLFVTVSCESCERAEEYLKSITPTGKFDLLIYNITEDNNAEVIRRLMKIYKVPENKQQVPILFFKNGYLSGSDDIRNDAVKSIEADGVTGAWEEAAAGLLNAKEDAKISKIKLAVTGFVNGLNPCGISMLLMVLSVLLMSGKNFYKGSFIYLAGKFLTYLLLG
ncbi:MAG: glutaredoxin family protein, partial [Lachnospiraceae bacterium]|nr:glutaredoxin family protein [Lachnospiraceae bacterium]